MSVRAPFFPSGRLVLVAALVITLSGLFAGVASAKPRDRTPPTAPTVTATAESTTSIKLSWTASTDNVGVTSYLIYRDGSTSAMATVSGTTLTYTDASLTPASTHSYVVKARDQAFNLSAPSNTATATTFSAVTPSPAPRPVGYSAHMRSQSDMEIYVDLARDGGSTSIRDEIPWVDIESTRGVFDWTKGDIIVREAAERGLQPLLLVGTSPQWASGVSTSLTNWWWAPPTNAADFGSFAGKVAGRYGSTGTFWAANPTLPKVLPAGIEVWNEPNIDNFWVGSSPDPVRYNAMLKSAYAAIKAADASMIVVSAGLSPKGGYDDADCNGLVDSGDTGTRINPVNYLERMYADGASGALDAVGWHPYNFQNGWTATQMLSYHHCSAWSQMEQTPVSVRSLMTKYGDGHLSVWATELGVPTCVSGASYACVAEAEQSNLATQQMAAWKGYSWAGGYYWYDLRDDYGGDSLTYNEEHFGAVRGDNSLKPAYSALRTAWTT